MLLYCPQQKDQYQCLLHPTLYFIASNDVVSVSVLEVIQNLNSICWNGISRGPCFDTPAEILLIIGFESIT